jgi:hypothetical protein
MAILFLNVFFVALFSFLIYRDIKIIELAIEKNKESGKIILITTILSTLMAIMICFNMYNIIAYLI